MKMTAEEYQNFKKELDLRQERAAKFMLRMDQTISNGNRVVKLIQNNKQSIKQCEESYSEMMSTLAYNILGLGNPFKKKENQTYKDYPVQIPIEQLAKKMMEQHQILIITGAGVSAKSGIPTFRGNNGLYEKDFIVDGTIYAPKEFLTNTFFLKHPMAIWNWVQQIYKYTETCKPNEIHYLIHDLATTLSTLNKKTILVTQNIDDLHIKPSLKDQYLYYNIHGNVKKIRCANFHFFPYQNYRGQIKLQQVIVCPQCTQPLRPHLLFFDEQYGLHYGEQIKDNRYAMVMVVGSSLSTGLCANLTMKAKEVIQINPNPVIEVGKVYQYKKQTEKVLKEIIKALQNIKSK